MKTFPALYIDPFDGLICVQVSLHNEPSIWVSVYKENSCKQIFAEWLDWQPLINGKIIAWYLEDDQIKAQVI